MKKLAIHRCSRRSVKRCLNALVPAAAAIALLMHVESRAADPPEGQRAPPLWRAQPTTSVDPQQRTFHGQAATLSGTLHVPRNSGPVPAVIVLHAASSPGRDSPLYRHLVAMLPPLGIAVFVFDRRGSGGSGGKLEDSDYEMLADDGIAAQRMLAQDPRIDPARIGFWGLSQGGWLALLAASRHREAAFAVAVSAPLTTPDVQMNFAVANVLRIRGFSQKDIDDAIATRTAVDDYLRGRLDRAAAQALLDIATSKPWFEHAYLDRAVRDPRRSRWAKEMRHDPVAVLERVEQPVLVIFGSDDPWVPVQKSVERMAAIQARKNNIELAVIAGADHAMATSVSAADQIDPKLVGREVPDSVEYFGLLAAWLREQGLAAPFSGSAATKHPRKSKGIR